MSDLLLELYSAQIPALMQEPARKQLADLATHELRRASISFSNITTYASLCRIVLYVSDLRLLTEEMVNEKRGPKVSAGSKTAEAFAKSLGCNVDDLEIREIKGNEYYFATFDRKDVEIRDLLKKTIEDIIQKFTWPKSMKWGEYSVKWIRPLKNILCLFDNKILPVEYGHIKASNITFGHYSSKTTAHTVDLYDDYRNFLKNHNVILETLGRKSLITKQAEEKAKEVDCEVVLSDKLLEELAGLAECPRLVRGNIEDKFMNIPKEIVTVCLEKHQRYITLVDHQDKLMPYFIAVLDIQNSMHDEKIILGYERVLKARLEDFTFYLQKDLRITAEQRLQDLKNIVFHKYLGNMFNKTKRLVNIAQYISKFVPGSDLALVERAALLSKTDLASDMVRELPELQGFMGKYYANEVGENQDIAEALFDHYKPVNIDDECPTAPLSIILSIADRVDNLVGFFLIDEKPTGNKDPFALRRAMLSMIRTILQNNIDISLRSVFLKAIKLFANTKSLDNKESIFKRRRRVLKELLEFLHDRMASLFKENSIDHEIILAVCDYKNDNVCDMNNRAIALQSFIGTKAGKEFIHSLHRIVNILKSCNKKTLRLFISRKPTVKKFFLAEEFRLYDSVRCHMDSFKSYAKERDYNNLLNSYCVLTQYINEYLDNVMVNTEDKTIYSNRVLTLKYINNLLHEEFGFSLLKGK